MERDVVPIMVGAAIGSTQTFILKVYVDEQIGTIIPGIGGFGTPSSVAGWAAGGVATVLGLLGKMGKGPLRGNATDFALSYGVPALIGGILSGYFSGPAPQMAKAAPMGLVTTRVTNPVLRQTNSSTTPVIRA